MMSLSRSMIFTSGDVTVDALSGKDVLEHQVFVSVESEEDAAILEPFHSFRMALYKTSAVQDRTNDYQHRGLLMVQLHLTGQGSIQPMLTGSLMMSPAAECLRTRFQREVAAAPAGLPPRFFPVRMTFSSPPQPPLR